MLARRLLPHNSYALTDMYHDTPERHPIRAHTYVCQRNDEWHMNIRRNGDLVSAGCIEVCGRAQVELALRSESLDTSLSNLEPVANMKTRRRL